MHRISAGRGNAFNTAVFSPNGNQILTSSDDGTARLFSVSTGKQTSIMTPNRRDTTSVMPSSIVKELRSRPQMTGNQMAMSTSGVLRENRESCFVALL